MQSDTEKESTSTTLEIQLGSEFTIAKEAMSTMRATWDDKESMLISKITSKLGKNFKSQVADGRIATIAFERSSRVMGELPVGRVQALTQKDLGKSTLMNLVLTRYIQKFGNAQHDHLTKLRMWDLYSQVYGSFPAMYDYSITECYIGPDFYLIPMRNFFPQPGKTSISDSEYVFISNLVSAGWLKDRSEKSWDKGAIDEVVEQAKAAGKDDYHDPDKTSFVQRDRTGGSVDGGEGDAAQIELITKYESGNAGHWITFAPDFGNKIVRDIPNPHKSGKIPVVLKHCFPLIDSMIGLGDFERGKTLQFAIDSLINLYLDGVKMSIFPPVIVNARGVVPSSIKYSPAAKWLETTPNSIRRFEVSPQGLDTFQSTYNFLTTALMNQSGTTDTMQTSKTSGDPAFGKTPEALQMLQARESSRDNWDRFMMEKAIEEMYEGMLNLLSAKQEKPLPLNIFQDEIEQMKKAGLEDAVEIYESGWMGKVNVTKKMIGNTDYRFFIEAGSTQAQDDATEHAALTEIMTAFGKSPELLGAMNQAGTTLNWPVVIARWFATGGTKMWDKFIIPYQQPQQQPTPSKTPFEQINYKDAPEDVKRQMEAQANLQPSQMMSPSGTQQVVQTHQMASNAQSQAHGQLMAEQNLQHQQHQADIQNFGQQFQDPDIMNLVNHIMNGGSNGPSNPQR